MSQTDRSYRPDIDGLRALAVVLVLLFHAFPALLPGGFIGVDVFFVISGYLISGIILEAERQRPFQLRELLCAPHPPDFPGARPWCSSRARCRLVRAVCRRLCSGSAITPRPAPASSRTSRSGGRRATSIIAAELKPLLHLWSLGVEEQFYLVWPVLLVFASRWRRGPLAATLAIGTASFLVAIWTVRIDRTPAFYAPWNRFWELLAGATLACIEADAVLDAWTRALLSRSAAREQCLRSPGSPRSRAGVGADRFHAGVSGPLGAAAGGRHRLAGRRRRRRVDQSRVAVATACRLASA